MKTQTVKAVFTNLLFVIGVILLIFGFVQGTQTIVKTAIFEKYPLRSYEETRCDYETNYPVMPTEPGIGVGDQPMPKQDQAEQQRRAEKCLTSLERERKVKQTEDIVGSVTAFVAGLVLVIAFHKFIFKK